MSALVDIGSEIIGGGEGPSMVLDVDALIGSHACAVANSGAGKSGLVRKILEVTHGSVPHIVLDPEDEFYTLREGFDYVIAGGDGADVPIKMTKAAALARTALGEGFSLIVQLNDLGEDAPAFVAEFLGGLMNAPRELWRQLFVVVDEVQRFAPAVGTTDATRAVKDVVQRGRKRGYTGIFASLRISEIDPGLRGLVNNWMLGRVGQSLDRDTMAKQLGFKPSSAEAIGLQALPKRQFWAFGPALATVPTLFRVADVTTTPVKPGQAKIATPPAPEALREILAALAGPAPSESTPAGDARDQFDTGDELHEAHVRISYLEGDVDRLTADRDLWRDRAMRQDQQIRNAVKALGYVNLGEEPAEPVTIEHMKPGEEIVGSPVLWPAPEIAVDGEPVPVDMHALDNARYADAPPAAGEAQILQAPTGRTLQVLGTLVAMPNADNGVPEKAWAMCEGIDRKSSTWRGHKAKLRGWFIQTADRVRPAPGAAELFPVLGTPPTGRALVDRLAQDLASGSAKALRIIFDAGRHGINREELARQLDTTANKSTFRGYIAPLSTLELIERNGDGFFISTDFPGAR